MRVQSIGYNGYAKKHISSNVSFKSNNDVSELREQTAKLALAMEQLAKSQAEINKHFIESDKRKGDIRIADTKDKNSKGAFFLNNSTDGMYGIANANGISEAQVLKDDGGKMLLYFTFNSGKQAVFEIIPTIIEKDENGKLIKNGSNMTYDEKLKYYADNIKDVMSGKKDSFEINLLNAHPLMMPYPQLKKDEIEKKNQEDKDEAQKLESLKKAQTDFYINANKYFTK